MSKQIVVSTPRTDEEKLEAIPKALRCVLDTLKFAEDKDNNVYITKAKKDLYEMCYKYVKYCDKLNKYTKDKRLMLPL